MVKQFAGTIFIAAPTHFHNLIKDKNLTSLSYFFSNLLIQYYYLKSIQRSAILDFMKSRYYLKEVIVTKRDNLCY